MVPPPELASVAKIVRAQGRKGEVVAELLTDFPDRFQAGGKYFVGADTEPREMELENAWPHKGRIVLKFSGVDSISDAEQLAGQMVSVRREDRRALPAGRHYIADLAGCRVIDQPAGTGEGSRAETEAGEEVGVVTGWEETGGVPLLRVTGKRGEVLVPFAEEICTKVDVAAKVIYVHLPEGLMELNWPQADSR